MECKKCKAQLEKGVTICPECGTDNTAEAPKGIVLTPGKLVAIVAAVVLLTALVVALIMGGMGFSFNKPVENLPVETQAPSVEATVSVTLPAPTIPADGDPQDVTCKGSYTDSDENVIANSAAVVATAGSRQLTNGQLQIYYWLEVQNFLAQYGSYAPYMGLDISQPLDTQVCTMTESGVTWQQYFLTSALANWHNYAALAEEAAENGFQIEQQYLDLIEKLPENLATDGALQGFDSAESYLAANVGAGASVADYQAYMTTYYQGFMFFQSRYEDMVPAAEELDAYFAEHEEDYAAQGVTRDGIYVDVRHILVLPEGATLETIRTETFPEEAWAAGEKQAQEILDLWLAGEMTEDSFAALANEKSVDPGSNTNGGLYTQVEMGMMVEEFEAWCFDESRQVGDYGIVRTSLGFHIMYFSGSRPIWESYAERDLMSERGMEMINAAAEKYPMTVEYGKISLGYVNMMG
jgi:hypothetical protein